MKNDDDTKSAPELAGLLETTETADGKLVSATLHGPTCARTREVAKALHEGREPPHPSQGAPCSGPAKVATKAYRAGWETIFGKPKVVGEA